MALFYQPPRAVADSADDARSCYAVSRLNVIPVAVTCVAELHRLGPFNPMASRVTLAEC